jgi:hypothetical protein
MNLTHIMIDNEQGTMSDEQGHWFEVYRQSVIVHGLWFTVQGSSYIVHRFPKEFLF